MTPLPGTAGLLAALALFALAVALLLRRWSKTDPAPPLAAWTLAWIGEAAALAATAALARLADPIAGFSLRALLYLGTGCAAAGWWIGLRAASERRRLDAPRFLLWLLPLSALALALFSALPVLTEQRPLLPLALPAALSGLALLAAAVMSAVDGRQTGRLLQFALALLGLAHMAFFIAAWVAADGGNALSGSALAEALLLPLAAVGTVSWLRDEAWAVADRDRRAARETARRDAQTGLPGRAEFLARVEAAAHGARERGGRLALVCLNIDGFRRVNDSLGSAFGDRLLLAAADRLRDEAARVAKGEVGRLGGDEFALLLDGADREGAGRAADRWRERLAQPFVLDGQTVHLGASLGVAMMPEDGRDGESLLRATQLALVRARQEGRGRVRFYAADLSAAALDRLSLESALRRALTGNELTLFYQPQIAMEGGRIEGFEALVRWQHPTLGLLPPARFVPLAELIGLDDDLGRWVLRAACRQAKAWRAAGHERIRVSINLGAPDFGRPDLAERVRRALDDAGLPADALEVEITESTALRDFESSVETARRLRQLGVRIALDDFGTGYSSLSYLRRLPLDALKIDQSFVRELPVNPADAAIATAAISVAHSLGLQVVAEGVENEAQHEILRRHHCDTGQGYYYGKPMAADAATRLLETPPAFGGDSNDSGAAPILSQTH